MWASPNTSKLFRIEETEQGGVAPLRVTGHTNRLKTRLMDKVLTSLISAGRSQARFKARSKKHAFEYLSELIAESAPVESPDLDRLGLTNSVMEALVHRERLGSTGLGDGIALPHASLAQISEVTGALLTLEQPIDYPTPDGEPVDVILALVAPEPVTDEHRRLLEQISALLSEHSERLSLRQAGNTLELQSVLQQMESIEPAAEDDE